MRKLYVCAGLTGLFVAAAAASSRADTVILAGPGNVTGDQNVLFNATGLLGSGTTVQGATNSSATVIDFSGAGESLTTPAKGQARITAADGDLTALKTAPHLAGTGFTSLMFNIDAKANGSVTITADRKGLTPISGTFSISKNGQNFFRITTSHGDVLTDVHFSSTAQISDVSQVRVTPAAVPLPAASVMGLGLIGAIGTARSAMRRFSRA